MLGTVRDRHHHAMTAGASTMSDRSKWITTIAAATLAFALGTTPVFADAGFQQWIKDFRSIAVKNGVDGRVYDRATRGVSSPDPDVLRKARYQPEFRTKVWDYFDSRVNDYSVAKGREMLQRYGPVLDRVEAETGVSRNILLAIWSMESSYGAIFDKPKLLHDPVRALSTLAYADRRRAKFGRTQLIAALKILQSGAVSERNFSSSWAGAMGHTQFIPTSYQAYKRDGDGDGKVDIWNSVPDALMTAANLLKKNGWRPGQTWGYEVRLPRGGVGRNGETRTLAEWTRLGFKRANGAGFARPGQRAELKLPAGANGPAFLMIRNFFVLKKYNNADKYALAVGHLADRIGGFEPFRQPWPRPAGSLNAKQLMEVQERLYALGYYEGAIDGNIGSGSRAAIARFQERAGLNPDGVASMGLLKALKK